MIKCDKLVVLGVGWKTRIHACDFGLMLCQDLSVYITSFINR